MDGSIDWRVEYTYTYLDATTGEDVENQLSDTAKSLIIDCLHAPEVARDMPESESDHSGKRTLVVYRYGDIVRAFRANWLRKETDNGKEPISSGQ